MVPRRLPHRAVLAAFAALALLLPLSAAAQIPRADVLECALPGDRRFILKAEYIWYPWANLTRSGNPRRGGTNFDAYYVRPDNDSLSEAPTAISHDRGQGGRHRACAAVGFIHDYPVVNRSFLMPNGRWFDIHNLPSKLNADSQFQPASLRTELRARHLVPATNFAFVVPIGERLVYEWPLTRRGRVEGVFKSESRDMGQTWSDPVITTEAEIFELGKYQREQSFVGRPLRYNGDPVEPWTD